MIEEKWVKHPPYYLIGIVMVGLLLRAYLFPSIPPGLNQDEAASAYEAYSLSLTGNDKWGYHWPPYFAAWGSGTNVLYAWLSTPFIRIFGLNLFTTRIINLIFGVGTLPLLYWTTRRIFDTRIALTSTLVLAILPWHVMASRWGLECNILPFFMLLGIYTISQALDERARNWQILVAFMPWALTLYTYATAFFVLPFLLLLILWCYRDRIWSLSLQSDSNHRLQWFGALVIYGILALPILLVFIKNFVFKTELGIEPWLPFSLPWLSENRYNAAAIGIPKTQYFNLILVLNGFNDQQIFNSLPAFPPLSAITFPFFGIGLHRLIRLQQPNLFLLWITACLPLLLSVQINMNRGNIIWIAIVVIAIVGFFEILDHLPDYLQKAMIWTGMIWIVLNSILFSIYYFRYYPQEAASAFYEGLETALIHATTIAAPTEKIWISETIQLPYNFPLFYLKFPPEQFQQISKTELHPLENKYQVPKFDRFYFDRSTLDSSLQPSEAFVYVLQNFEPDLCAAPTVSYESDRWKVGRCQNQP